MKSNQRKLKLKHINSLESFKREILWQLQISDVRIDCVPEFTSRIQRYLQRNRNQVIYLLFDLEEIRLNIRRKIEAEVQTVWYPDGFEFGQPHMAWGAEPDLRSKEERDSENIKIELLFNKEYRLVKEGLLEVLRLGDGRIVTDVKLHD